MDHIDCHRHLGGCITPEFVWEVIKTSNASYLAESLDEVRRQMIYGATEPRNFHRFLTKFKILDEIDWTEDLIDRSIRDVSLGLESDNVDYAWLDFSINKYMKIGWHKHEAVKFIYDCFERHRPGKVGLVLALKYESMQASQRQYAKLIEHEIANKCLIGIDLVGDELQFNADFYSPIFRQWRDAGKMTRAHVGESQGLDNVKNAIEIMGVTNIAHGLKLYQNEDCINLIRDRDVTFDMAITTNYLSGVWSDYVTHPSVWLLRHGIKVTIGSDDPVQCNTTLSTEHELALTLGWSQSELHLAKHYAAENVRRFRL